MSIQPGVITKSGSWNGGDWDFAKEWREWYFLLAAQVGPVPVVFWASARKRRQSQEQVEESNTQWRVCGEKNKGTDGNKNRLASNDLYVPKETQVMNLPPSKSEIIQVTRRHNPNTWTHICCTWEFLYYVLKRHKVMYSSLFLCAENHIALNFKSSLLEVNFALIILNLNFGV